MWESWEIHTGLICLLVPKSLEIPYQMGYLTKSFEVTDVPCESMKLPIDHVHRLIQTEPPPYLALAAKTVTVPWIRFSTHGYVLIMDICGMLTSALVWTWQVPLSALVFLTWLCMGCRNRISIHCLDLDALFWKGLTYQLFLNSLGSIVVSYELDKILLIYLRSLSSDASCFHYSSVGRGSVVFSLICPACTIYMGVSLLSFIYCVLYAPGAYVLV